MKRSSRLRGRPVVTCNCQLEVLHTPRGTSTGYSAATIDVAFLPMSIEHGCYRVYCVRVCQCVGVTAYRIYNNVHIETEEVGPNVTK